MGGTRDIYLQRLSGDLSPRGEPARLTTGLGAHTISIDRAGKMLAYSVYSQSANIWSAPISPARPEAAELKQITRGNQTIESGFVSPDGKWLAYDSNINGNQDIFKMPIDGGESQQLTRNMGDNFNPYWSPDGSEIAFHSMSKGNRDVYVMDESGKNLHAVAATPREELAALFQGNSNTILFLVFPDSMFEVRRNPGNRTKWGEPRFLKAGIAITPSRDGTKWVFSAGPGIVCPTCPPGGYISDVGGANARPVPVNQLAAVAASFGAPEWDSESRHIYLPIRERDGTSSIWEIGFNGNPERRLVWLRDPEKQFFRTTISVGETHFYFPIGDRQSDVWTMELKKQ
jgi:hypothetical protein